MAFSSKRFFFLSWCFSLSLCSSEQTAKNDIEVQLKEPYFKEGILKTERGGIVTSEEMRLQARIIQYTNKVENGQKITELIAQEEILLEYRGSFFTGSKLQYDFIRQTGTLWDGRTGQGIWFIGGDVLQLSTEKGCIVQNAFVTTSESQDLDWAIHAKSVSITPDKQLSASNIHLNIFHVPVLWFPSLKSNLGFVSDPPIRYRIIWDKGVGPRATVRYRFFSWEELNLFFRLDYRLTKGPGAAFESEYLSQDNRTLCTTRSYGAYDKVVYDESGLKRYRLQGLLTHESLDKKTHVHLTYDKFSDLKMISDFPSSDFEIDSQKRTRLLIEHKEDIAFSTVDFEPRLNNFDSINQKLPLIRAGIKPFSIGNLGIFSENSVSVGYLDYVYANEASHSHSSLHERHAARLETKNQLYRPFFVGPCHVTPSIGIIGIFYNNNQKRRSVGQGAFTYGGDVHMSLHRRYENYTHRIDPYIQYTGLTRPKADPLLHYTFTIEDGLHSINSLRLGIKNTLFSYNSSFFSPNLFFDLYTYGFFGSTPFAQVFPKSYLLTSWSRPSYRVEGFFCWNFQESLLDFSNLLTEITVNENAAFAIEFRHRSRFDFRKANHENFLVNMAHPTKELRDSLLSDGRNTCLGRLQVRLSPKWSCHLASHYGWGRMSEPSYLSFKMDLLTLLASKWQLKFSYTHTTNDDRFAMQMQLVK
jgi:hypothetical protein